MHPPYLSDPIMTLETITPAIAAQMMKHNTHNRPVSQLTVVTYCRLIRNGDFLLNGDCIRFDWNGVLIDGQHRLMAIIATGITIRIYVIRGLDPAVQATIDGQRKRGAGDVLALMGMPNGNKVASIVRFVYKWDMGERSMYAFGGQNQLTTGEVAKAVAEDPIYCEAAEKTHRLQKLCLPRVAGTFYLLANRVSPAAAEYFVDRASTGVGLEDNNPILTLRNTWTLYSNSHKTVQPGVYLMAGVRAWNTWVEGREISKITYKSTDIPEILTPKPGLVASLPAPKVKPEPEPEPELTEMVEPELADA